MAEFTASEDSLHSQGGGLGRSFPGVDHVHFQPCFDTRCMQGWDLVFLSARSSIHAGFISEIGLQTRKDIDSFYSTFLHLKK